MSKSVQEAQFVSFMFTGSGEHLRLKHFPIQSPREEGDQGAKVLHGFEPLWNNERMVSAGILVRALRNNNFKPAMVYCTKTLRKSVQNPEATFDWFQVKVVFKSLDYIASDPAASVELSNEQIKEVRTLMRQTHRFSHARFYEGPVANIGIIMVERTDHAPHQQITVRDGVMCVVPIKGLTTEELQQDLEDGVSTVPIGARLLAERLLGSSPRA